jgi:hypothetical protein
MDLAHNLCALSNSQARQNSERSRRMIGRAGYIRKALDISALYREDTHAYF